METAIHRDYPVCLDLTTLPPTHNHMIGAVQAITLDNVIGTVAQSQALASLRIGASG